METACWEWNGRFDEKGYGVVWSNGKDRRAHRVAYETFVGGVPKGLELDHLCRNRACVNPDHLEPVAHAENMQRGVTRNSLKTHCPQGHPYNERNTILAVSGKRTCRECNRVRSRERMRKRRAENPEAEREYMRQWRAANIEPLREYERQRLR